MEFQFANGTLFLPPIHFTLITIIVILLLVKWSKQLETRRFTIFFYFLLSTTITPFYSYSTGDDLFRLWFPLGFILVFAYLISNKRYHPNKMKASLLGLCIAIYRMILEYTVYF